jgi:glycerol-3-phosphate dehydrogenase
VVTPSSRAARLAALGARTFDVLVVGGGITGCGIAHEAALRGLDVALIEKDDFASGTSSRSSRLIHGGVRYLEHGHLHLVFESSAERRHLLRLAPHLVRPLEFIWPVYAGARIPRWKLAAGLFLYDALSLFRNVGRHRQLRGAEVVSREPALRRTGLRGGARYFDAATDDARLTLAAAMSAADLGATIVNHAVVRDLLVPRGKVMGAVVLDTLDVADSLARNAIEVQARVVVNATGPWSDELRRLDGETRAVVRGSKGAHIAVPRDRLGARGAVTVLAPRDARVCFILPGGAQTIVGTTDGFTDQSPDHVGASSGDIEYLLEVANTYFPDARLTADDVVSAWAGIRPLIPTADTSPRSASREHLVTVSERGLISITGGKLTTYRVMAADVVDVVMERLSRPPTRVDPTRLRIHGGDIVSLASEIANAARTTRDDALAAQLVHAHGSAWRDVWAAISATTDGRVRLGDTPTTLGELRYSAQHEMAETVADLLIRRTRVAFEQRDHALELARAAARAVAPVHAWDAMRVEREVAAFSAEVDRMFRIQG